jgi:hypothetical protein
MPSVSAVRIASNAGPKAVPPPVKGMPAIKVARLERVVVSVTRKLLTLIEAVLADFTTEISYVSEPPTGMSVLTAVDRPLTIVVQLVEPMLPDRSRMKPSWITAALAGATATKEAVIAAAAHNLRNLLIKNPPPIRENGGDRDYGLLLTRSPCLRPQFIDFAGYDRFGVTGL